MKKKFSAVLLAALLGVSSLAACFGGGQVSSSQQGESSTESSIQAGSSILDSSSQSSSIFDSSIFDSSIFDSSIFDSSSSENGGGDSSSSGGREYGSIVDATDKMDHLVPEHMLLHDKTITPSDRVFTSAGTTDYIIIVGIDDGSAKKAANFLFTQIGTCTGAYPQIYMDTNQDMLVDDETLPMEEREIPWSEDATYIVYSHEKLEAKAGITWRTVVDLAYSGYMIKSVGDSVFFKVNSHYGYQTVTLAFCREVLGYEWYADDMIVYTKDGALLPTMDIVEKPDFDLVDRWMPRVSGKFASGMTDDRMFSTINGNFCHNTLDYLPVKDYLENHKDWYAYEAAQPINQLCYSAHGNKAEYDLMLRTAFEGLMKTIAEFPDVAAVSFTRQDGYGHCICDTCTLIANEFNGSLAVTYMFFMNDLDDLIQAELQRQADEKGTEKRDLTLLFFAYSSTASAPVFGTDGKYTVPSTEVVDGANIIWKDGEPITLPYNKTYENGLKCNENVGLWYAPIDATFEESFYHLKNKEFKETFEKWGLLANRLYAWIYDTNFVQWLVPYNSHDAIPDTLRFLRENNCQYVFNQAQANSECTGFGSLKTYLNMTLARDVNLNAGELLDKYFANYFGEAGDIMREYYEMLVAHMEQLQVQYPEVFYTARRTATEKVEYWPLAKLQGWLDLCDKAYLAVEKHKNTNPDLYKVLVKHIKIETLFPRFMICEYYSDYYTPADKQAMRVAFYEDCKELDYQYYAEGVPIQSWFVKWGVA